MTRPLDPDQAPPEAYNRTGNMPETDNELKEMYKELAPTQNKPK